MKFCKYEDLERLARDYSDGMFSLIFPKLNSREKSLKCIERVFTAYIDESPRLRSSRAEEKWLIKRLRKESGFNRLANTYKGEGLSFIELDNMLTSLRVYYNNEGNKPKKRRSALWSLFVVIIIAIVVTIGVVQGIGYYEKSGGSVQEHLNSAEENWAYQSFDMIWRNCRRYPLQRKTGYAHAVRAYLQLLQVGNSWKGKAPRYLYVPPGKNADPEACKGTFSV